MAQTDTVVLTARQAETLQLVGLGLSTSEIGERMGITRWGAKAHILVLCHKFGVKKKRQLVPIAQQRNGRQR